MCRAANRAHRHYFVRALLDLRRRHSALRGEEPASPVVGPMLFLHVPIVYVGRPYAYATGPDRKKSRWYT